MHSEARKQIWPTILKAFIPALLIYLGKDDRPWSILPASVSLDTIHNWQIVAVILGTGWAAVVVPIQLAIAKVQTAKAMEVKYTLTEDKVRAFCDVCLKQINCKRLKLNVRYFRHAPGRFHKVMKKSWRKEHLKPVELKGITDKLLYVRRFEVHPNPEGVVGKAFTSGEKQVVWNRQQEDPYPVHEPNRKLVDNFLFVAAYPLRSRRPQDEGRVIGVLSIDCQKPLDLDDRRKIIFNTFVEELGAFVETQLHNEQGKNEKG